jgi:hypothetical protein
MEFKPNNYFPVVGILINRLFTDFCTFQKLNSLAEFKVKAENRSELPALTVYKFQLFLWPPTHNSNDLIFISLVVAYHWNDSFEYSQNLFQCCQARSTSFENMTHQRTVKEPLFLKNLKRN